MNKKSLVDVRNILFTTIDRLMDAKDTSGRDGLNPMDLDTAKTITAACTTIVNSAKVEMDVLRSVANAQNPHLLISFIKNAEIFEMGEVKQIEAAVEDGKKE